MEDTSPNERIQVDPLMIPVKVRKSSNDHRTRNFSLDRYDIDGFEMADQRPVSGNSNGRT